METWHAYIIITGQSSHYHIESGVTQDIQAIKREIRRTYPNPKAPPGFEYDSVTYSKAFDSQEEAARMAGQFKKLSDDEKVQLAISR